jgi:hypothetical protein
MFRVLLVPFVAALLVLPALPAPATRDKKADEPLGPVTEEQLKKSRNNIKQFVLAYHNYNDTFGFLPTNQLSKEKKPLLSWRVQILPFIEQDNLYKQFKLDEPWDSPNNIKLVEQIPPIYVPVRGRAEKGQTFYQAFGGSHGWLKPGASIPASFPDGLSNTFVVAEAAKPVIWTKPDDLEYDGKMIPDLGGMFDGRFTVGFGDGSTRRFLRDTPKDQLKLFIDPSDGMPIPDFDKWTDRDEEKK